MLPYTPDQARALRAVGRHRRWASPMREPHPDDPASSKQDAFHVENTSALLLMQGRQETCIKPSQALSLTTQPLAARLDFPRAAGDTFSNKATSPFLASLCHCACTVYGSWSTGPKIQSTHCHKSRKPRIHTSPLRLSPAHHGPCESTGTC